MLKRALLSAKNSNVGTAEMLQATWRQEAVRTYDEQRVLRAVTTGRHKRFRRLK